MQERCTKMDHLGSGQCNSAVLRHVTLGGVGLRTLWETMAVGAAGREGREMWRRLLHPWEGSAGGLVLPPSTSEDKDTWRGPGMLMANSTPIRQCIFYCIFVSCCRAWYYWSGNS